MKRIAVTGGSSGIGLAVMQKLKRMGYQPLDVSRRSGVDIRVWPETLRFFRDNACIDTLVHCAGVAHQSRIYDVSNHFNAMEEVDTNLKGTLNVFRAFIDYVDIDSAEEAVAVAVGSTMAHRPSPGHAVYAATKAAMESFVLSLNEEYSDIIRFHVVSPGRTDTPLREGMISPLIEPKDTLLSPQVVSDFIVDLIERGHHLSGTAIPIRHRVRTR